MQWARARVLLFKIFYSTAFTSCFLLLLAHIVLTPADAIYQSYKNGRFFDIIIFAAVYILTGLLAVLLYASRLYTNRSVLREIPKTYMPVEKEDLPTRRVRVAIEESLARSAVIAYLARPRSHRIEDDSASVSGRVTALMKVAVEQHMDQDPTWGRVAHPGWTAPNSPDLPSLQYESVVKELPDLIEAKAVSLAPIDPLATPSIDGVPMPDERMIEVLQRPSGMGMRQYVDQLALLGVIENDLLCKNFLALYERARFAADPMTETEFRSLMSMFAEILRAMVQVDADLLPPEDDNMQIHDQFSEPSSSSDLGSVRRHRNGADRRLSEDSSTSTSEGTHDGGSLRTAPVTQSGSRPAPSSRWMRSGHSLEQTRSNLSTSSRGSSKSGGGVIRLARAGDPHDLPYTIQMPRVDTI